MATPCRHTFSGAVVACLLAAAPWLGGVPAANAGSVATSEALAVSPGCPPSWPVLHAGSPDGFDGNVSVLVGGNLSVNGAAAGAEGTVVALGNATFARDVPGLYEVGVTALGSQVTPYAGADMLVVGGNLDGAPGTHIDVGQLLGGDVVVGGTYAADLDAHGGQVYTPVGDATAPYLGLAGQLAGTSAAYAALPTTGTAEVTDDLVSLVGDGVSSVQVFTLDASQLAPEPADRHDSKNFTKADHGHRDDHEVVGRALQFRGVPDGAAVVVNLTGDEVGLDIDSLVSAEGMPIDPLVDPAFATLATHLLWNAPTATTVDVSGLAQLPGSLLVPSAGSTTTIANLGTNGRILVGGNLVHTGLGELHAYPFLPDPQLGCAGDPVHLTSLTLDVVVVDNDGVVDTERFFEGTYKCTVGGVDVTPADNTWRMRASSEPRVLSDQIPAGASCTVKERLGAPPAPYRSWADPSISPELLVAVKRQVGGFVITNKVKDLPVNPPETPSSTPTPTQTPTPTDEPTETETVAPPPPPSTPTAEPTPTPSTMPEPTNRPTPSPTPTAAPTETPTSSPSPTSDSEPPRADAPSHGGPAGPLTTTAPFTLRGAFVWGPLLMLSLLTLLLRVRRRPRRVH